MRCRYVAGIIRESRSRGVEKRRTVACPRCAQSEDAKLASMIDDSATTMIEIAGGAGQAPIRSWLPPGEIERAAMQQLENAAQHPEVGAAVAVMPDCHVGFGVTIGCVFPTVDSVIPNAVGVDIGCGMCAVNTGVALDSRRMDKDFWRGWMGQVQRNVPTGFGSFKTPQNLDELDRPLRASSLQKLLADKARFQIGTLGGGNHFMEAQVDQNGEIWLMVHSGSRQPACGSRTTTTGRRPHRPRSAICRSAGISRRCGSMSSLARITWPTWNGRPILRSRTACG